MIHSNVNPRQQPDLFVPQPPDGIPDTVLVLFESFTFALIEAGIRRYSSDAILHRIRWHHHVEKGDRDFKCNDHWTAGLARWFMAKYPQHAGFFETRIRKERNADVY